MPRNLQFPTLIQQVLTGDRSYTLQEDAELAVTSPRTWETGLAGMPTARFGMGTTAIDGIVYATGGNVSGGTNVFQAYDPASHTWTTLPTLPQTADGPATVALDGELYAIGGWGPSVPRNTVQIYSPTTNAWRSGTALSFYSGCNQAGVIDGKIYLLTACDGYGGFRQRLDRFDPATNSWTQLADSPHVHSGAGAGVIDGKLYVAGGGEWGAPTNLLDVYDPGTNTWSTLAAMPTVRDGVAAGVIADQLYVVGGGAGGAYLDKVEVYDPVSNSWTERESMPTARTALGAAVVGDTLYTVGGYAGTSLATVEAYHAVAGVLANDSDEHGRTPGENNVPLTAQVETGPTHAASFALYDDGTFTYTPAANYNGTDQFTYRALDSLNNASTPATVTITINAVNDPPLAEAGPGQLAAEGSTVAFDGTGSSDLDGDLLSYHWEFGDGETGGGSTPTHVYADNGEYTVTVTVTDDNGGTASDTLVVTVRNVAPTAEAGGPYTGNEGSDITLTAAASSDPGNDSLIYEWDLNHNGTYETTGLTATFNSTADGTFLVGLRVTDDDGASATGTATVTVSNVAPHADAGGPYIVELGTGVGLDASGSADPGHDIASYAWDLDSDGQFDDATGVLPTVSWASLVGLELAYPADPATGLPSNTIRVLVTDSSGMTSVDTATLTFYDNRPFARVDAIPDPCDCNQSVNFAASRSFHGWPGRSIVKYEWDFDYVDGSFEVDASGPLATYSYPYFGSYTAALRVTDNNTPPKTDLATLVVNEAPTAVTLSDATTTLAENVDTTSRVAVAQIQITDDAWGSNVLSLSGPDSLLFEVDGQFLYLRSGASLDYESNPVLDVTVAVEDASVGATPDATAALAISLSDVNEAPVLTVIGDRSVIRGQVLTFVASATDEDLPATSPTFTLDAAAVGLGMTIATATGDFSWTPTEAQGPNSYVVTITVTDNGSPAKEDFEVLTITVLWWQNPRHYCDVTADGYITPDDVLVLINDMNSRDSGNLLIASPRTPNPPPFLDPSGDGVISPLDALMVINYINQYESGPVPQRSGGEGEYDTPLGGEDEATELTRVIHRHVKFASEIGSVGASTWSSRGQRPVWPALLQLASRTRSNVIGSRMAPDTLLGYELETSEIEEAISEIADEVADAWKAELDV